MNGLEKFRLEETEITQEAIEKFERWYNINLLKCSASDIKLLVDFLNNGASHTIMARILEISEAQQEPIEN